MSTGFGLKDMRKKELVDAIKVLAKLLGMNPGDSVRGTNSVLRQNARDMRESVFSTHNTNAVKDQRFTWGRFSSLCSYSWNKEEKEKMISQYRAKLRKMKKV